MKLKEVLDPEMEIGSPEIVDLKRDREQVYLICYDPTYVPEKLAGELMDRLWRAGVITLWAPIKGGVQALGLKKDVPNREESERVREYELKLSELLNSGATNAQVERWFVDVMRAEINRVVSGTDPVPRYRDDAVAGALRRLKEEHERVVVSGDPEPFWKNVEAMLRDGAGRPAVDIEASIQGHMVGIVEQLNRIKPRYSIGPVCDLIREILREEISKQ